MRQRSKSFELHQTDDGAFGATAGRYDCYGNPIVQPSRGIVDPGKHHPSHIHPNLGHHHDDEHHHHDSQHLTWMRCDNCQTSFIGTLAEHSAPFALAFCSGECRFSLVLRANQRRRRQELLEQKLREEKEREQDRQVQQQMQRLRQEEEQQQEEEGCNDQWHYDQRYT